jgi:hypothetical protein
MPHGKGPFAVQVNKAHGRVAVHGRGGRLCRVLCLCRALSWAVVVPSFFAMRLDPPLPCRHRCRVLFGGFAVGLVVAVLCPSVARQRNLCRARAHGRVCRHGSTCFSGSAYSASVISTIYILQYAVICWVTAYG